MGFMAWGRRGEKISKCGNGVCELLKSRDIGGKDKRGNFRVPAKRRIQGNFDGPCQQSEEKRGYIPKKFFFFFCLLYLLICQYVEGKYAVEFIYCFVFVYKLCLYSLLTLVCFELFDIIVVSFSHIDPVTCLAFLENACVLGFLYPHCSLTILDLVAADWAVHRFRNLSVDG